MNVFTLAQNLRVALQQNDPGNALAAVHSLRPADLAETLDLLETHLAWQVLKQLPGKRRAEVFGYCATPQQLALSHHLQRTELVELVAAMSADERADLFNQMDSELRATLLPALAQAEREDLCKLAEYPEGCAGALMTSAYATLAVGLNAAQAIDSLRHAAPDAETLYQSYVVDEHRRLLGTVSLRQLILAPADTPISQLMVREVISAQVNTSQEQVAKLIERYDLLALPITNGGAQLVGIVTYDDAMDVVTAEATVDFHKGAGVSTLIGNLKDASISLLYRKRVFWLVLLVFGNLFSGAGIAAFEDVIAANIALVFFLPLLVDSGGNAGSQSATLMVRALATGEVVLRDWLGLLRRECLVALALGITMAAAVSLLGLLRGGPEIALVVASSMVVIVIVGSLIGMSLPFVLHRLGLDPATASAPLITSIADASGVLVYFAIASQVLSLN